MSFIDNPIAEAILVELRRIATAQENLAATQTRMLRIAEGRNNSAPAEPKKAEGNGETKKRQKPDPKDILTVTGHVLHFGQAVNAATNEPKLTKKGREYWVLKLTNDFIANVFSETQAALCSKAYDEQVPLIIEYVIKQGQYSNIENIRLGGADWQEAGREREPGEDDESAPF